MFSSNTNKEYILDALEILGVPRGFIVHFRYRKKWIYPSLWDKLPMKSDTQSSRQSSLFSKQVLLIYLYQKQENNQLEWKNIYPIRFANIEKCYKTGKNDHDIAHFYCKVHDYCDSKDINRLNQTLLQAAFLKSNINPQIRYFASLHESLTEDQVTSSSLSDESSFFATVNQQKLKLEHFESPDSKRKYYPVFYFIRGLRTFNKATKSFNFSSFNYLDDQTFCYWNVIEGKIYVLESSIYLQQPPNLDSRVELLCPEKRFGNWDSQSYLVASSYDEFSWQLIPSSIKTRVYTMLTLKTDIKPPDNYEALNLSINIPIIIKVNKIRLFIETLQDISFASATAIIGWFGIAQKLTSSITWPIWLGTVVAFLYILGVILKIILHWFYGT